jgi:protein required for attachment to host cells
VKPHWFLVADAARASVFEQRAPGETPKTIETFDNDAARETTHEQVGDRPGRAPTPAGGKAVLAQRTDPADVTKDRFARELAGCLAAAAQERRFTTLSLLVPAPMLGRLRDQLPADVVGHIVHEVATDLTKLPTAELASRLAELRPHLPLEL